MSGMDNLNKIGHVKLGDSINYYKNGVQAEAKIVGINGSYLTVSKADSTFETLLINDTLFIKDILTTKSWNDMNMEERTEQLQLVKAYSPRYLSKTWEQLPKELQSVLKVSQFQRESTSARIGNSDHMRGTTNEDKLKLREAASTETGIEPPMNRNDPYKIDPTKEAPTKKRGGRKSDYRTIKRSDQEQGAYGNIGGRPHVGISTDTKVDAEKDYEGQSHEDYNEQFKHESKKPKVDDDHKQNKKKQNGEEKDLSGKKTKTEWNGMMSSKSHQKMLWESWLQKEHNTSDNGSVDNALNSNMDGTFNIRLSDKNGRYIDQGKDKKSD